MMLHGAKEEKLVDGKEAQYLKLIRSHYGGVTKAFENPSLFNNYRVDTIKIPRPNNPSNLYFTLLYPLASQYIQLHPHHQGKVVHTPNIVTSSVAHKGEVWNVPEGGGGNFGQDPEGGFRHVPRKNVTTCY